MMRSRLSRHRLLLLTALLWIHRIYASQVNITIDDSDPSILYIPVSSWRSSSTSCTQCLVVDESAAYNRTYHAGTHVLMDADDLSGHKKGGGGGGRDKRLDPDDPGFLDTPVTAQFKFNGTAVYVYSIQPVGQAPSPLSPTNTNLSFTLDNQLFTPYIHTAASAGTVSQANVLALTNLTQSPHVLLVNVGINSTFLFDYMVYTTEGNGTSPSSSSPEPTATSSSSKKHNVATFGGAVGGSLGVLSVFAFCLFLSICCRRRKAAKRERRERRERQPDQEAMIGPRPFIPRYFPGTVPPPYTPPTASFHSNEEEEQGREGEPPQYAPPPASAPAPREATYADVPPSSPAPTDDLSLVLGITSQTPAPPPFGVAVSTPAPRLGNVTLPPATASENPNLTPNQNLVRSEPAFSPVRVSSSDTDTDIPVAAIASHERANEGEVGAGPGTGTERARRTSIRTLTPPLSSFVMASPPQFGRK